MKYQIVESNPRKESKSDFEERITRLMNEGWEPTGGIEVIRYEEKYAYGNNRWTTMENHYFQAMVKK